MGWGDSYGRFAQLVQDRNFVAVVEFVTLHAYAPNLLGQRFFRHCFETEPVKELGHVCQSHDAPQTDPARLLEQPLDEHAAEAMALELVVDDEAAYLAEILREYFERSAARELPANLDDEKVAQMAIEFAHRTGQQVALRRVVLDEVMNIRNVADSRRANNVLVDGQALGVRRQHDSTCPRHGR